MDQLREAWSLLHSSWRGEGAEIFAQQYLPKLIEYSENHDMACKELTDALDSLERELEMLEIERLRE